MTECIGCGEPVIYPDGINWRGGMTSHKDCQAAARKAWRQIMRERKAKRHAR